MSRRSKTIPASCAALAMAMSAASVAHAKDKPEVRYYLSRTDVAASVTMTLASCPSETGELAQIATAWSVVPTGSADPAWPIPVDLSSGFLAKRSNAFEFFPNGTLSSFNGSSEGQGGVVLNSILKTVASVAPLFNSGPGLTGSAPAPAEALYCRKEVSAVLKALGETKADIRALEDKVLLHTATSADVDLLERRRARRIALGEALTFEAPVQFSAQDSNAQWIGKAQLPELLEEWFSPNAADAVPGAVPFARSGISGLGGYGVTINPIDNAFIGSAPSDLTKAPPLAQRSLVYRRPILAKVVVTDLACRGPDVCSQTLQLDAPLAIGQWGAASALPVGTAGLFGSREASASFDPFGTPLKLSYGSDSGGAAIGASVEAAGSAATAIAEADTAALERAIKREELRQKLRDLRAEAAASAP